MSQTMPLSSKHLFDFSDIVSFDRKIIHKLNNTLVTIYYFYVYTIS